MGALFRTHGLTIFALALLFVSYDIANAGINHNVDTEDNEFAEFEDFETEEPVISREDAKSEQEAPEEEESNLKAGGPEDEEEVTVEVEDNEFEHVDEDEYEGYEKDSSKPDLRSNEGPKITFAQLPAHLRYCICIVHSIDKNRRQNIQ